MVLASILGRLDKMFGGAAFDDIQIARQAASPDAAKKKEAEDIILKEGKGICTFCKEEIYKNENMPGGGWVWESESMVGYCNIAKDRKHKPQIKWTSEGGVENVQ
jgi:hypothetical protein